tara:strand:- start:226 stop:384 length:159 start_codon:yes stop_codon:yes gene_type:complete
MNRKDKIKELEQEASANLTLFRKGQDTYAITRYQRIMEQITNLRKHGKDNRD